MLIAPINAKMALKLLKADTMDVHYNDNLDFKLDLDLAHDDTQVLSA